MLIILFLFSKQCFLNKITCYSHFLCYLFTSMRLSPLFFCVCFSIYNNVCPKHYQNYINYVNLCFLKNVSSSCQNNIVFYSQIKTFFLYKIACYSHLSLLNFRLYKTIFFYFLCFCIYITMYTPKHFQSYKNDANL